MNAIYPAQVYNILLTFVYKCYSGVSTFGQVFICALLMFKCPLEWISIKFCSYTSITMWKVAQRRSWVSWPTVPMDRPQISVLLLGTLDSPAQGRCTQDTPPQPCHFLSPLSSSQLPTPGPALSWAEQDAGTEAMRSQRLLEGAGTQAVAPWILWDTAGRHSLEQINQPNPSIGHQLPYALQRQ